MEQLTKYEKQMLATAIFAASLKLDPDANNALCISYIDIARKVGVLNECIQIAQEWTNQVSNTKNY